MKIFAILGPTASGKSALALELAEELESFIFSLDSLSIYQEIDIASAKPSTEELQRIRHFGINLLKPDAPNNAALFAALFQEALRESRQKGKKALLIVGGSSFYLKAIIEGLSPTPTCDENEKQTLQELLTELPKAYHYLQTHDPIYSAKISPNDRYRIQKGLEILLSTGLPPTEFFGRHPKKPLCEEILLYEIAIERPLLRERIAKRTETMLASGLLEEVHRLEERYGRTPQTMKSIGIKETLEFFDGTIGDTQALASLISTHTAQLAKRQQTFNRTQFQSVMRLESSAIFEAIQRAASS